MTTGIEREQYLKELNGLLREKSVLGNVQYMNEFSDPGFHGYWYFNAASRGFLGKNFNEAYDALCVLIDSVHSVRDNLNDQESTSWIDKIKRVFG